MTDAIRTLTIRGKTEGMDKVLGDLGKVDQAQEAVAGSAAAMGTATETAARKQLSVAAALERVQRSVDADYRAHQALARVTRDLDRAMDQGLVTLERRGRLLDLAAEKYMRMTRASEAATKAAANENTRGYGLSSYDQRNLGFQVNDILTMAGTGASPMQIISSQFGQIQQVLSSAQGGVRGAIKGLAEDFLGFLTPVRVATAGIAGFGLAAVLARSQFVDAQREIDRALTGIGAGSGATRASLNQMAEAAASANALSVASAREMATSFAATGRIGPQMYADLTIAAKGYAYVAGTDLKAAADELAKSFADPVRGADTLNEKFGFLDARTRDLITRQSAQGNASAAQRTLMDAMAASSAEAARRAQDLETIWAKLGRTISNSWDSIGKAVDRATGGGTPEDRLRKLTEQFGSMQAQQYQTPKRQAAADFVSRQMDAMREQMVAEARLGQSRQSDIQTNRLSLDAQSVISAVNPEIGKRSDLENQRALLEKALGDPAVVAKLGVSAEQARDALTRLTDQVANFTTAAQRRAQDYDLEIRQIASRTLAERAGVDSEKARIAALREGLTVSEAAVEAERARNRVISEANRQAQDTLRDSINARELAGLKPYQRGLKQIEQEDRDQRERLAGGGAFSRMSPEVQARIRAAQPIYGPSLTPDIIAGVFDKESGGRLGIGGTRILGPDGLPASSAYGIGQMTRGAEAEVRRNAIPGFDRTNPAQSVEGSIAYLEQRVRQAGSIERGLDGYGTGPGYGADVLRRAGVSRPDIAGLSASDAITQSTQEKMRKFNIEQINGPLEAANDEVDRQTALLARQRAALFGSEQQMTAAAKAQELLNQYTQAGVTAASLGPEAYAQLVAGIDAYGQKAAQAAAEQKRFNDLQDQMKEFKDLGKNALSGFISDLRQGTSAADALKNALDRIADRLIDMALNSLFKGGSGGGDLFSLLRGLAGGSGYAGGDIAGGYASAASSASAGLFGPGFAAGGYTGFGGKYDPAGIVHRGEYVFDAAATSRIGVGVLDGIRGGLKGYADGGYVHPDPYASIPRAAVQAPANANMGTPKIEIVNNTSASVRQASVETASDGTTRVVLEDAIEGSMARRLAQGRGPLARAANGAATGRNLRG